MHAAEVELAKGYVASYIGNPPTLHDEVRTTILDWNFVTPDESGNLTVLRTVPVAHPSPVITLSNYTLSNLHFSSDNMQILGDMHFVGTVSDAFADTVDGSQGTISNLDIYLNGLDTPYTSISTTVSKSTGSLSDMLHPYAFSASFDTTLSGVVLTPGFNGFKLMAIDPVLGIAGYVEGDFTVNVQAPEPVIDPNAASLQLDFTGWTQSNAQQTIQASIQKGTGSWTTVTLTQPAARPVDKAARPRPVARRDGDETQSAEAEPGRWST